MGNFLFWHCRWIRALFVLWTNLTFLVCWRRFSPYHFTLRIKPARERGDFQSFRHGDLQLLPPGSQDLGEEFLIYNFPKYWILTSSSGQHCILRIALLWAQKLCCRILVMKSCDALQQKFATILGHVRKNWNNLFRVEHSSLETFTLQCCHCRERVRDDGDPAGQAAPVRGQLPDPQPRAGRPPGGSPSHAPRRSLRGERGGIHWTLATLRGVNCT